MKRNYRYVRFKTPKGVGYALFGLDWEKVGNRIDYKAAGAFCNPLDTFLKERSRNMVNVYLDQDKRSKSVQDAMAGLDRSQVISNSDFDKLLPMLLASLPNVPGWVSRAYKQGLVKHGLSVGKSRKTKV